MKIIAYIFIFTGTTFSFLGALGIVRMKDIYTRLQTSTKATTLGAFATIIGVGFLHPSWMLKCISVAFFILFTSPIASHSLARATHKAGIKLNKDQIDSLESDNKEG
ncbi:MAG: monovalent cation/H(+) antiporter subunit G [bacterium]|nr:monovalent cation/H(+) antiporter subunit G [bacterium]